MTEQEPTVQVPVSLPTREQIAEAHRYQEGDAGDGYTEPREWWASCSCGASLAEWQQFYNESDEDPHKMYALHLVDAALALLSQPTPTSEPPRIEDLESGTLLELGKRWTVARDHAGVTFLYAENDGYSTLMPASAVDPSTIRHVQQPTNAS